jgi:hypothetical protein
MYGTDGSQETEFHPLLDWFHRTEPVFSQIMLERQIREKASDFKGMYSCHLLLINQCVVLDLSQKKQRQMVNEDLVSFLAIHVRLPNGVWFCHHVLE